MGKEFKQVFERTIEAGNKKLETYGVQHRDDEIHFEEIF